MRLHFGIRRDGMERFNDGLASLFLLSVSGGNVLCRHWDSHMAVVRWRRLMVKIFKTTSRNVKQIMKGLCFSRCLGDSGCQNDGLRA